MAWSPGRATVRILAILLLASAASGAAGERRAERIASLEQVFYRVYPGAVEVSASVVLPGREERRAYRRLARASDAGAFDLLDTIYGRRDLKALAFRDSDGDGTPDFRVSDYYGKLGEGDVDVDGDGVRNLYDSAPFDAGAGGRDSDGDGIPDVAGTFRDANGNGLPDHLDWAVHKTDPELADIQLGLFRDFKIILVERTSEFDLALARAVDDAIRVVFRPTFGESGVLPTLRTVAAEDRALLNERLAAKEGDNTSAQVFAQTQSLIVYDEGRFREDGEPKPAIGLLGLVAHEIGHSVQFSRDFDAGALEEENRRTEYPAAAFLREVEPFGWARSGWNADDLGAGLDVVPQFFYAGISEPTYTLEERTAEEWNEWLMEVYASLDESPDYLQDERFTARGVVSDYSLTTPWEWHAENLLAYLVYAMEEAMREEGTLTPPEAAPGEGIAAAEERITLALRAIWPGFYHRNIAGTPALAYFRETFPIARPDLALLADRYLGPLLR